MKTIAATYYNGHLKLEKPLITKNPIKVQVTFDEDAKPHLNLSDFSFLEGQDLLKDFKGSFSDEVIEERRSAL